MTSPLTESSRFVVCFLLTCLVFFSFQPASAEFEYHGSGTVSIVGLGLDEMISVGDPFEIQWFYPDNPIDIDFMLDDFVGVYPFSTVSLDFNGIISAHSETCNIIVSNNRTNIQPDAFTIFCDNPPFDPGPLGGAVYNSFMVTLVDDDGLTLTDDKLPENLSQLDPFWEVKNVILTYNTTINVEGQDFPITSAIVGEFNSSEDTDGDGIIDFWEINGLDFDLDGDIDIDFPALGADPMHKDLFLELDYMSSHKPTQKVIDDVIAAFADAPSSSVNNPDGLKGINLHIDLDESVSHQDNLVMWSGFDSIKDAHFGTPSERNDEIKIDAKKYFYRYGVFIHNSDGTGSSGRGELPGNDFVVSLGGYRNDDPFIIHQKGSVSKQTSTLMHEFGHTLSLRHGGGDNINCKPNYLSIMSYAFQFKSLVPSRPLDYSRESSAPIDENNLVESVGIESNSFPETIIGSDNSFNNRTGTGIPIDYNNDGDVSDTVPRNITNLKASCRANSEPKLETLHNQDDWSNILYDFRGTAAFFAEGDHPELSEEIDEMTQEDLDEMIANTYPLLCYPKEGDWNITSSCELGLDSIAPANVFVQNNSVLTIPANVTLTITSGNNITIEHESGVLVKKNGSLQINS